MKHGKQFPEQIVLRVTPELRDRMESVAAQEKRTVANLARLALEQWVDERELASPEAA
jgi:predicted DNA-binding protein